MKIQDINQIILDSSKLASDQKIVERPDYQDVLVETCRNKRPLKVLTGLRRSGKSFQLKILYQHIIHELKIPKENILFINFEHPLLRNNLNLPALLQIYSTFLQHADESKAIYLFLDEIQNILGWESFVRTLYDSGAAHLYVTGSNSQLLSSEYASSLGGRVLELYIQPFCFSELVEYHAAKPKSSFELTENKISLLKLLNRYIEFGGIPETFDLPENLITQFSESLIEKIIVQDILERYKINRIDLLKKIIAFYNKANGGIISIRNLANITGAAQATVSEYLQYLFNTYIYSKISKHPFKTKESLNAQPKCYASDNIFINQADSSQKLENAVLCELSRRYGKHNVTFAKDYNNHEIDFIANDLSNKRKLAVQVCWELNDDSYQREIRPLLFLKKFDRKNEFDFVIVCMQKLFSIDGAESEIPAFVKLYEGLDFFLRLD